MDSTIKIRPSELHDILKYATPDIPIFIWGGVGIGKTDIVHQVSRERGLGEPWVVNVSARAPHDFMGLPVINAERDAVNMIPLHSIPVEGRDYISKDDSASCIVFFDECNTAHESVQPVLYRIILEGKIEKNELPRGAIRIAAGNREKDVALVKPLSMPLRTRFLHLELEPSVDDWIKWGLTHKVHEMVIAFVRARPSLLYAVDPSTQSRGQPCPRTWHKVSVILENYPPSLYTQTISGLVGEGSAIEFLAFLREREKLPDLDKLLSGAIKEFDVPEEADLRYILATGLAYRANSENISKFFELIDLLPATHQVISLQDISRRDVSLLRGNKDMGSWWRKHKGSFELPEL
jgi:hypothetical protein